MNWNDEQEKLEKRFEYLDDPEDEGGWWYAPDFLGVVTEVMVILFPKRRKEIFGAYASWCAQKAIHPDESTAAHSITRGDRARLIQRFLSHPDKGLSDFIRALRHGESFKRLQD